MTVHLIGICGTAMATLAAMLLRVGEGEKTALGRLAHPVLAKQCVSYLAKNLGR